MRRIYSPYVKLKIIFDGLTKRDLSKFERRLRCGRICSVQSEYNFYGDFIVLVIEYPNYKKAISAAYRYKTNPKISFVEVETSTIRIK